MDRRPAVIKLALLTQLAVFKDIIPGYRIRKLTDAEKGAAVSKEVRKLRNFEETLLSNYQAYLQSLDSISKANRAGDASLLYVSILCMTQLLTSVTHFNYRLNLITVIVANANLKGHLEVSKMCCDSISTVFKEDGEGEVSLECVKLIADWIHTQKYAVLHMIIDTFQHLRLQTELAVEGDTKKRKVRDPAHVSKKMKKVNKHLRQAMTDMEEAEAVYDKDAKQKSQGETLKFVFLTYFRVLKNAPATPLVPSVLEGLALFAHLINVDFFQDLLNVLKKISNDQQEQYLSGKDGVYSSALSAFHCIIAAFELLDSVGGALSIDLRDFYSAMYTQISRLSFKPGSFDNPKRGSQNKRNEVELLLGGIESMLKKNREIPAERVAAFVKRIATLCLSTPPNSSLACLFKIKAALTRFPRLESLLDEDGKVATGIYDPLLDDPNLCNPFATSLWELIPLSQHYHPAVASYVRGFGTSRVDFSGTDLTIAKLGKAKNVAIHTFAAFKEDGFTMSPAVSIPTHIAALDKKLKKGNCRIDGPSSFYDTQFMLDTIDLVRDL